MIRVLLCAALLLPPAAAETYLYWIEPCTRAGTACRPGDVQLAEWALEAWRSAGAGRLILKRATHREQAHIRIRWAGGQEGLYGEARPIVVDGRRGAEVFVRPDLRSLGPAIAAGGRGDRLFRDSVVYLTCLHESGHALGLRHTCDFDDIMYAFGCGGDVLEYFRRYRRRLKERDDIRRVSGISDGDRRRLAAALDR